MEVVLVGWVIGSRAMRRMMCWNGIVGVAVVLAAANVARGDIGPDGFDWVHIGAAGNRAFDGPDPFNLVAGRGGVGYEYHMARTELTTAQAVEFFNAALARPDPLPFANQTTWWGTPIFWGAQVDPTYSGPGTRFRVNPADPNAGMRAVGGLSWRQAAIMCNWLENDKATTQSAFMNGAYDVLTFTPEVGSPTFNDQLVHNPSSRYWIPTLDEWMKAVHYDPNANGGLGRWWEQPNGTDTPLVYGPPPAFGGDGTGMANSGFSLPGFGHTHIPLGSYPNVQTPWGLLDAAGGTTEWLESTRLTDDDFERGIDGSYWGTTSTGGDLAYLWGQSAPSMRLTYNGVRLASSIPSPSSAMVILSWCGVLLVRRRKESGRAEESCRNVVRYGRATLIGVVMLAAMPAHADIDPLSGIDFVNITHPGNAPWAGDGTPDDQSIGRGGVGYEYRIGKFEITTAQYVEFLNAAFDRAPSDWIPHLFAPGGAGFAAVPTTPNSPGGRRWIVPAGKEMNPVGATDWRSAAIYANWLHNFKSSDRSAFLSGAYDVGTFGYITLPNGVLAFTDQAERSPGARYFIPTLDEWIKAAHYDPAKPNPDGSTGGYWTYSNASDAPYIGAPPSQGGTANFGFDAGAFTIPLGAYTNVRSPWGLYDVAGGSFEWTERILTDPVDGANWRMFDGSSRTTALNLAFLDSVHYWGAQRPNAAGTTSGFRIAAAIPSPATLGVMAGWSLLMRRRRGGVSCAGTRFT